MPISAVSPWTLILQGRHQDNVCTGLLGSCPGCPRQSTWWASSSHISGLTIVSEYPRSPCHCIPDMAPTSTPPYTKTLFDFYGKNFLAFVLPPACLHYANIITHMACSPPPYILMVLEQCVATVCDFWCSERATEHRKLHWEPHRRRYYYLHCGTSNLTLLIWETLLWKLNTSASHFFLFHAEVCWWCFGGLGRFYH